MVALLSACSVSGGDDTDSSSAFSSHNPKEIESNEVYSLYMYEDSDEDYNRSYFKFTPTITSYHTIHLGTEDKQDLDIYIYSDDEFTSLIDKQKDSSIYGEIMTFNFKANQTYYIMVDNYDNSIDVDYNLLITQSSSTGFYTKELPLTLTLNSTSFELLTFIGYDSILNLFDDDEEEIYLKIDSTQERTLYIKTQLTENTQDIDIKVYSDSDYSDIVYQTSSLDTTQESVSVGFATDTSYYVKITNFTNDAEGDMKLMISGSDF